MTLFEIVNKIEQCVAIAKQLKEDHEKAWAFFEASIRAGNGQRADEVRPLLHGYLDAHMDNWASAITLNELLIRHPDNPVKR